MNARKKISRFFVIYTFLGIFFVLLVTRLVYFQLINGKKAEQEVISQLALSQKAPAPRGKICDRNETVLAGNRKGFIITVNYGTESSVELTLKSLANACNMDYNQLKSDIGDKGFSKRNPYVFSEDAEPQLVTKIMESPELFPNVKITETPVREYFYPETAVHLLGRCGIISKAEYEKNTGYSQNDYIGKQGAEKAFESILKGKDGTHAKEKYTKDGVKTFCEDIPAIPGNNVILTIDLPLQEATEKVLETAVLNTSGAIGGAVVVTDVNSGEILALASNPFYNINDFNKEYTELSKNKKKPFFNRCLSGLYEPGSTFKPITAIAAIENGYLLPEEKIRTYGKFKYFDRTFRCNIYKEKGKTHGTINVSDALAVSCNYFFYELGSRVGIEKISELATAFGLDSATGIELKTEEAIGATANPQNRAKRGENWYGGDTLQAAIGQSDNLFTPLALANYAAALGNGGTVYKAHILKETQSPDGQIKKTPIEILNKVPISDKTLSVVKKGMQAVTKKGTAASVFSDFPIEIAAKTGTSQVSRNTNGLFIGFAPIDKPEIAFCVVIEGGGSGTVASSVAKNVLSYYFNIEEKGQ